MVLRILLRVKKHDDSMKTNGSDEDIENTFANLIRNLQIHVACQKPV
jgi:hypothetical protein